MIKKILSVILIFCMILSLTSCGEIEQSGVVPDQDIHYFEEDVLTESVWVESVWVEDVISEDVIYEDVEIESIAEEQVWNESVMTELALIENKISDYLTQEEPIEEVIYCKTNYIEQDMIGDYSEHSQLMNLFSEDINILSVLKNISIGTGIIITLAVVKRVGFSNPIASAIFASASEKSTELAIDKAKQGILYGSIIGVSDEIDESGLSSAVLGFAIATVGLIMTSMSLATLIPSQGTSSIPLTSGIKLAIAGIQVGSGAVKTVKAGYDAVHSIQCTDIDDIDWGDIDLGKVGISAVQESIKQGAEEYMWGSIVGAVNGGIEGYEHYQNYNAPYISN